VAPDRTEAVAELGAAMIPPRNDFVEVVTRPAAAPRPLNSGAHLHDHDLLTTADGSRRLSTFVDFMRAAGLSALLEGSGQFTVFAPVNRAFASIPLRDRDALLADRARLIRVMRGHVVSGHVAAPPAGVAMPATTLDGEARTLTATDGTYRVDGARIVQTNILASNGVIHAIDRVLF
jgi:uncharacterized surface protein with fasciclin (FAS1) repeats